MIRNPVGDVVADCWRAIPRHFPHTSLDEWVVMPNHIHGIIVIHPQWQTTTGCGADCGMGRGSGRGMDCHTDRQMDRHMDRRTGRGTACRAPTNDTAGTGDTATTGTRERLGKPVAGSIPTIIRSFKSAVTRQVNVGRKSGRVRVWQRNYWEHVIRGDAVQDRYGAAVCGIGRCVMERDGAVMCSNEPRGSAALDRYAKAVCTGGCEPAQASRCKPLTK